MPPTQTRIVIMQPFTENSCPHSIPKDSHFFPLRSEADVGAPTCVGGNKVVFAKQNYLRTPSIIIPIGQVDKLRHRKKIQGQVANGGLGQSGRARN